MSTPPRQKQHLYLVLDESEDGRYSIHKIDVGDFEPDDTDDPDSRARPLPDPPLVRVEAECYSAMLFVAHGTKIFAMHPSPAGAAPALDPRTMAITAGPLPQAKEQKFCCSAFVSIGDRFYSMDEKDGQHGGGQCNFEVMRFGSPPSGGGGGGGSSSRCWSWSSVPSQPPFDPFYVTCYAVHPDGRTIFFSVSAHSYHLDPPLARSRGCDNEDPATFSFDTEALKWTFRGYWSLPFEGQAHYDVELDAWVGLHCGSYLKGRVCSCDVLSPATDEDDVDKQQAPAWKLGRDKLFRRKGRRHLGGTLVYMGDSTFCVLECVTAEKLTKEQRKRLQGPPRALLYLRTFGLKYGKQGRLRMATCGRRARCYALPEGTGCGEFFMSFRALWV